MRVLSIPSRRHAQNSYFQLLWDALEATGIEMVDPRSSAALIFNYHILQLHFPEHVIAERPLHKALLAAPLFVAYVGLARMTGKKLVWTIHEVYPKNAQWLARPYLWCMRVLTDAYVFMNRTTEDEFLKQYPDQRRKKIWRLPHSSHPITKLSLLRRREIRNSLTEGSSDCMLIGYLGEIRPYKNPNSVNYLPDEDSRGRPVRLVVAGALHAFSKADEGERVFHKIAPPRLIRIPERLSDQRLSELMQSVDVVFLPYISGWNSGLAMFALGCGARLLCSALPMFREIAETVGRPWVYIFDQNAADRSSELAAGINHIAHDQPSAPDEARLEQFLKDTSFERAASRYLELYRELLLPPAAPMLAV